MEMRIENRRDLHIDHPPHRKDGVRRGTRTPNLQDVALSLIRLSYPDFFIIGQKGIPRQTQMPPQARSVNLEERRGPIIDQIEQPIRTITEPSRDRTPPDPVDGETCQQHDQDDEEHGQRDEDHC